MHRSAEQEGPDSLVALRTDQEAGSPTSSLLPATLSVYGSGSIQCWRSIPVGYSERRNVEVRMKLRIFIVKSGNSVKRSGLAELEANVNEWLADQSSIVIEHTNYMGHPNIGWGHTAMALWYSES